MPKKRRIGSKCLNKNELLLGNKFFLLDTGFLAYEIAEVEQTGTTHFTALEHLNVNNIGRRERENTLYTYAIRHFANGEGTRAVVAADLDDVAAECLYALLVAFDDFIIDGYVVARKKFREVPFRRHLFVYKLDRVH